METEPDPFVGDAVSLEPFMQEPTGKIDELRVLTADDDPAKRSGLTTAEGWPIRFDHEPACGIDNEVEAVTPEAVHRDRHVDIRQERSQMF
jgi:hypothetical protein